MKNSLLTGVGGTHVLHGEGWGQKSDLPSPEKKFHCFSDAGLPDGARMTSTATTSSCSTRSTYPSTTDSVANHDFRFKILMEIDLKSSTISQLEIICCMSKRSSFVVQS